VHQEGHWHQECCLQNARCESELVPAPKRVMQVHGSTYQDPGSKGNINHKKETADDLDSSNGRYQIPVMSLVKDD
jgi:hypothetical protein